MRLKLFVTLALAALAPACKREPSFDERYAATQEKIEAKSQALDRELVQQNPPAPQDGQPPVH